MGVRRRRRLQGLPQVDPVRRAGYRRRRGAQGDRAGPAEGRGLREGPGLGPRDRDPLAPGRRSRSHRRQGRDPASAQRLPPPQAAPGLRGAGMARETGPQCKQCRREGQKLFLKGERCLTDKCGVERRAYPPGDHGRGRQKQSEYRVQLREKQKARRYYGVLEKQFRSYYEKATNQPGITGENLLAMLGARLDNGLGRLGFAASRRQARQLSRHGHWTVNGRRVDIPSFQVREGDVIAVKANTPAENVIRDATELTGQVPAWLQADHDSLTARILRKPERREVAAPVQEQLIVELYSK